MRRYLVFMACLTARLNAGPVAFDYVFRVQGFNCGHVPDKRALSGFQMAGTAGIVTALHGVVDCRTITALNTNGKVIENLHVSFVDVARDIALLTSRQLTTKAGLSIGQAVAWKSLKSVTVYGSQLGLDTNGTTVFVHDPPLRKLRLWIPDAATLRQLQQRNSPNLDQDVLGLENGVVAGHSGAPVVDAYGNVVAIANGGLINEQSIAWAIPISAMKLSTASDNRDLDTLRQYTGVLFAFGVPVTPQCLTSCYSYRLALAQERDTSAQGYQFFTADQAETVLLTIKTRPDLTGALPAIDDELSLINNGRPIWQATLADGKNVKSTSLKVGDLSRGSNILQLIWRNIQPPDAHFSIESCGLAFYGNPTKCVVYLEGLTFSSTGRDIVKRGSPADVEHTKLWLSRVPLPSEDPALHAAGCGCNQ
jgi:hypothetical protein